MVKKLEMGFCIIFYLYFLINDKQSLMDFSLKYSFKSKEGNGNPLQCSCLENPRDGGAWWAAVSGVTQSRTRLKRLSSSSFKSKRKSKILTWHMCIFIYLSMPGFKMTLKFYCFVCIVTGTKLNFSCEVNSIVFTQV